MPELGAQQLIWLVLGTTFGAAAAIAALAATRRRPAHDAAPAKSAANEKEEKAPAVAKKEAPKRPAPLPKLEYEEDIDVEPTKLGSVDKTRVNAAAARAPEVHQPPVLPRTYDADAVDDEPTQARPLIVTSASAQTDAGLRRKRNEDSLLVADAHGLYVVADGMGGYSGGALASQLAVKLIGECFEANEFPGDAHEQIPRRASELARAVQRANAAIFAQAQLDSTLEGMGTTVVAARFSVNKQRLYVAHVGDSRMYRLRDGGFDQMTQDHTMSALGVEGPTGAHLSRAVGIWPVVPIDIVFVKPLPNDRYLLCSDGLTKMVAPKQIAEVLEQEKDLHAAVERLIATANANGGKDNVTVVVVHVDSPSGAPPRGA